MKNTQIIGNDDNILSHLSISKLKSFPKHPFKVYDNEKMLGLADSIKDQGVVVPILVRPIKDSKYEYEIIAGHNRVQASKLAGIEKIPCNVREMDDETEWSTQIYSSEKQYCLLKKHGLISISWKQ